jgi:prolyl-tRNA synthetase
MKDLYSFDATQEDAYATYDQVAVAYRRIFERIGVPFVVAEADSGNIGGSKSHEYHLISTVGEDTLLTCKGCGYTANEELAVGIMNPESTKQLTIARYSGLNATEDGDVEGFATILTPEGRLPNLLKVQKTLSDYLKQHQQMSDKATMDMHVISSDETSEKPKHIFIDDACTDILTGNDTVAHTGDHFRLAQKGDVCSSCQNQELDSVKAIECGHTFYLGTKYSKALDCGYREGNQQGDKMPAEMGCYGIGISRLLAAVAEARYDTKGIAWPQALAPYTVCIVPTDDRKEQFKDLAETVYDALQKYGYQGDVVIDDRRSGFGAKMKDAELVGYPYTVIIGPKAFGKEQLIEVHDRRQGKESIKKEIELDVLLQENKSIEF